MNPALLPWHQSQWELLLSHRQQERLPHALLFSGPVDCGKARFAELLAYTLLCRQPTDEGPCGKCHSCNLLNAGNHPDVIHIEPEEPGKAIKVDVIRQFTQGAVLTPQIAERRITIISPAEAMNQAAANSLLKTLEEPSPENHMILLCNQPSQLPATIRSRCQAVTFPLPDVAVSLEWLQAQGRSQPWGEILSSVQNAPLRALSFVSEDGLKAHAEQMSAYISLLQGRGSPFAVAGIWMNDKSGMLFDWLFLWSLDLLRAVEVGPEEMHDQTLRKSLSGLISSLDSSKLSQILSQILLLKRGVKQRNLNMQIQLEALAIRYTELR